MDIIYPLNIQKLFVFYFLYIILLLLLLYKLLSLYKVDVNNKYNYYYNRGSMFVKLIYIVKLFNERWISFEKYLFFLLNLKGFKLFNDLDLFVKKDFIFFGKPFVVLYYKIYIFIIYVSMILFMLCLYVDVLYYCKIYYSFYILVLISLERLLGFIQFLITVILDDDFRYAFDVLKLTDSQSKIYNTSILILFDCYNLKYSNLVKIMRDRALYDVFVKEHINYYSYYMQDYPKYFVKFLGRYLKEKVQKHRFITNIISIVLILLLITILLYINSCF